MATVSIEIVGILGVGFTVNVVLENALEQLLPLDSHLTLNVFVEVNGIFEVICKGVVSSFSYHFAIELAGQVADNEILFPLQIVEFTIILDGFSGFGITVIVAISLESEEGVAQELTVQIALYVLLANGLTIILVPVNPPDHVIIPSTQADEFSITDSPKQILEVLGDMTGFTGTAFTVIVMASLESDLQPEVVFVQITR
jgi:hypothetical protein